METTLSLNYGETDDRSGAVDEELLGGKCRLIVGLQFFTPSHLGHFNAVSLMIELINDYFITQ